MNEGQQERASLYALGLLDADEAAEFERELAADGELRTLTAELREAVASLVRTASEALPPPRLRARLLARVAKEARASDSILGKPVAGPAWTQWISLAAAAALAILCVFLRSEKAEAERHWLVARSELATLRKMYGTAEANTDRASIAQVAFCTLEPVPAPQQTGPQAAVLWDAARRRGRLHISGLPPAGEGKDYQLWTVETGIKDPVNSGLVKVGADNIAEVEFQPQGDDGKGPAVAFALSRERAGGVPKNEGPILFLGKLQP